MVHASQPTADQVGALTSELGFSLPPAALEALAHYLRYVVRWNTSMNLIGASSWQSALRTLVVDSLHLAPFIEGLSLPAQPLSWDLGAGAGLPGIPLRALWQQGEYVMVEAREKRALFLATVLGGHPLPGTRVERLRAEVFFARQTRRADCLISRAFMPWPKLLPFVEPFLTAEAHILVLSNEDVAPEPASGWQACASINYKVEGKLRRITALKRFLHAQ